MYFGIEIPGSELKSSNNHNVSVQAEPEESEAAAEEPLGVSL